MFKDKPKEPVTAEANQAEQTAEFPKKGSSQNGTTIGYSVEVRWSYPTPAIINGMLLGDKWQRAKFEQVQPPLPGVPIGRPWNDRLFAMIGLYDYAAAQALRWWFHANADASLVGSMCLESRIVAHSVSHSYSEEAISAHCFIGGEDRTNFLPDWNTPKQPKAKSA